MSTQTTVDSIREINLLYLEFAQRMLHEDPVAGVANLGLTAQLGDLLASLTLAQIAKLAGSDQLLCLFRFSDNTLLSALTHSAYPATDVELTRAAIPMVSRPAGQFA